MIRSTLLLGAAALALAACDNQEAATDNVEAATEVSDQALDPDSRFAQALEAAGMAAILDGPEPYTLLVPEDSAFPPESEMGEDPETLAPLLSQHILPGTILREDIVSALEGSESGSAELPSYGGENVTATRDGDTLMVAAGGSSARLLPDGESRFDNGVVHRIDALLNPGTDTASGGTAEAASSTAE